jgi:hypothetical protein
MVRFHYLKKMFSKLVPVKCKNEIKFLNESGRKRQAGTQQQRYLVWNQKLTVLLVLYLILERNLVGYDGGVVFIEEISLQPCLAVHSGIKEAQPSLFQGRGL